MGRDGFFVLANHIPVDTAVIRNLVPRAFSGFQKDPANQVGSRIVKFDFSCSFFLGKLKDFGKSSSKSSETVAKEPFYEWYFAPYSSFVLDPRWISSHPPPPPPPPPLPHVERWLSKGVQDRLAICQTIAWRSLCDVSRSYFTLHVGRTKREEQRDVSTTSYSPKGHGSVPMEFNYNPLLRWLAYRLLTNPLRLLYMCSNS